MDREKELREQIVQLKAELEQLIAAKNGPEWLYCSNCREVKPISEFYKSKKGIFRCYCKPCDITLSGAAIRTPKGRDAQREAGRKARERERELGRMKARGRLADNIHRGRFPRASTKTCIRCGKPAQDYHHHNGYDLERWNDVIPVCRKCHNVIHTEEKAAAAV